MRPPLYVAMGFPNGLALCLDISEEAYEKASLLQLKKCKYWRLAGAWSIGYRWKDGVLLVSTRHEKLKHANGTLLVEISKERWIEDNNLDNER